MKTTTYITMLTALLAITACSQDGDEQNDNIIRLSASVSGGETRAAGTVAGLQNTQFQSGKTIHVEAYDNVTGNTYYQSTGDYTTADGGVMSGSLYYPATGNNVDLKAFYPASVNSSTTEFEVSASQTTADLANYQNSDLMYIKKTEATNLAKGSTVHPLTFYHAMSQIIVNIQPKANAGVEAADITSKVTAVKILNTVRQATLTIDANGEITPSKNTGQTTSEINITGTGASNVGLIVPQQVDAGTNFISITYTGHTGDFVYAIPTSGDKTFTKGTKYTYTFEVGAASISLKSLKITSWATDTNADNSGNSGKEDFVI